MLDNVPATIQVASIGLIGGLLLGLAARFGGFCTLGAIEDFLYKGDETRLRMWALAIGVAITGSFVLMGSGALVPTEAAYLRSGWNPLASIMGGLVFGYGMALAGTCAYGALARLGGGDLRAFVIAVVMGVSTLITLSGPLAELRLWMFPDVHTTVPGGYAHALTGVLGIPPATVGITIGLAVIALSLASSVLVSQPRAILWGGAVGVAVVIGWAGTSHVAYESFGAVPVVSHTFAEPLGDSLIYLMTASGTPLSFGVGAVAGVIAGAVIGSVAKGHFRWEACEDPRELRRQIAGAALMGVGAGVAGGCTIGQGISAFSLLAYGAPLTLAAIMAGAALGLRQLISGLMPAR
ncbi:YeeE/YedE family protein [Dichotomicrobium thermohalophilum]|uniref:Uncharacterized protein n=1 Tax=Dichotomicrobium thermohalophilum TaxID=933063 RepID=A0A397Q8A0_9HYPH|nr:YeeE/YedE family protein [Dichotomicrobium thermohalophilum]RIA56055.1 hypothetical protein BXY53_1150 [Dichotomicrobium thermohalophilum]